MQQIHSFIAWPLTVYYDGACPLCSAEIRNLMQRNHAGLLRFEDASAAGFCVEQHLPAGISQQTLLQCLHAKAANGRILRGVDVFRACYAAVGLPQISRLLSLPLLAPLADRLYPWVVRHRHWAPRWLIGRVFDRAAQQAAEQAAARRCEGGQCSLPAQHAPAVHASESQGTEVPSFRRKTESMRLATSTVDSGFRRNDDA